MSNGVVYEAAAVISTVSAGVLKSAVSQDKEKWLTFDPVLPEKKVVAIQKLLMGSYTKYFLKFSTPIFTSTDPLLMLPAYDCRLKANVMKLNKEALYPGSNAVLVTLLSETSLQLSKETPAKVLEEVLKIVSTVAGKTITKDAVVTTQVKFWDNEPHVLGAYSDRGLGFNSRDLRALKEPTGRVFFAGETMDANDYGPAKAAWISSEEAAKAVMAAY